MAEIKAIKPSAQLSPAQVDFVSFVRELYQAAQSGDLRELHGVAVYFEDGEPIRLPFCSAGDQVLAASEIVCDLQDLAEDIRLERRAALDEEDDD